MSQVKTTKRCAYQRINNTVFFYKKNQTILICPQNEKERKDQLPLRNNNGIAWYVWSSIPLACQGDLDAGLPMQKLGT